MYLLKCFFLHFKVFKACKVEINQKQFTLILISRRSVNRFGTRLFSRGIDENGHVSNFVETEQIILYNQDRASFVQIRGSIPLHWSQLPNLRYKSPITIAPYSSHQKSMSKHVQYILSQFESMMMINLVNHTGPEKVLLTKFCQIFHDITNQFPNVTLECFDFHHECRHNRWDKLNKLLEAISSHIDSYSYFASVNHYNCTNDEIKYRFQKGCFRTNCIDSIDRTNVVQSLIAKCSLERQLQQFGIILVGQQIEHFPSFYYVYRNSIIFFLVSLFCILVLLIHCSYNFYFLFLLINSLG